MLETLKDIKVSGPLHFGQLVAGNVQLSISVSPSYSLFIASLLLFSLNQLT